MALVVRGGNFEAFLLGALPNSIINGLRKMVVESAGHEIIARLVADASSSP
jgi:hypothetical protein